MTATHAPAFIADHPDKHVRSILYACWVATFNTPEHHCGLRLAQTQVRCMLFACHDGRNAHLRDEIDRSVDELTAWLSYWRTLPAWRSTPAVNTAIVLAQHLAKLREPAEVTP